MGINTTVLVMNDALRSIEKDPYFGKNLAEAIAQMGNYKRINVPALSHANAAVVVESHHADGAIAVVIGGNRGIILPGIASSQVSDPVELLRAFAKSAGYRLVKAHQTKV